MGSRAAFAVVVVWSLMATVGCAWFSENREIPAATLHPGETISADVSHVITESGGYVIPNGAFRLRLDAHGNITYRVQTPTTVSSGTIVLGGLGSSTASLSFSGPGTAVFGIESGYVSLTMSTP